MTKEKHRRRDLMTYTNTQRQMTDKDRKVNTKGLTD